MKIAPSVVLLLISFVLTLYQVNGHYWDHNNWNIGRGCYWFSNCRECSWYRCTECDPGYNKYRGFCVRRCPGGLVPKKGTCSHPYPGCRYAFMRGCEICKSRWSCEKCAPGFLALKEPFQDEMRCVTRCPSSFKKQRNQELKMDMCKFNRPCKLRGNCLRCSYSYRKCLNCDVGHVVKMNEDKTDISCKPVSKAKGCPYAFMRGCEICKSKWSCQKCAPGYLALKEPFQDEMRCVTRCPSSFKKQRNQELKMDMCKFNRPCKLRGNCLRCSYSYRKCLNCDAGHVLKMNEDKTDISCKPVSKAKGCPYAFMRGCEICKSKWSCQKCAPGYLALKEPFQDEMRCVSRCPSSFKKQRNQELKMDMCKFNRPCKLRGNCLRCSYSYRKCLNCDVGKVVKTNEDKTDISCKPVSKGVLSTTTSTDSYKTSELPTTKEQNKTSELPTTN